jgi:hypothetical protein
MRANPEHFRCAVFAPVYVGFFTGVLRETWCEIFE